VETIGIILADTMLYLPDYTAAERTFQLLYQVAGRAGRRQGGDANVIVQTYSPKHPAITAAVNAQYQSFIKSELAERKLLNYPPYVYLLKLSVSRASRPSAQATADKLATQLRKRSGVQILGPAPAWRETLRGQYHWQIIVKTKVRHRLVDIANSLPSGWTHDLDPINLL
jgi:primosomal protein N' (replication factor Y)